MSTVALSPGHIRVNDSNSNAGWSPYNKGGATPGSEGQNAYQGNPRLAVNGKINSTVDREGVTYDGGSVNTAGRLVLLKCTVADNSDLNAAYGVELAVGSGEGNHYEYNVAGTGANNDWYQFYNAVGGIAGAYLFVAIDPSIAEWREATIGNPNLANVSFYAVGAQFVDGQAKSENVALDAIDIGSGLTYTGTNFTFQDGVDADQGDAVNRWGWVAAIGTSIFLRGRHVVNATGTDESTVSFPDGYHSAGLFGITANSTNLILNGSYECLGQAYATTDTRGDFIDTGSGLVISGQLKNWRLITLNASTVVSGSLQCETLTQAGSQLSGAEIRTQSVAGVASCDDPAFGNLIGTTFVQTGAGHAVEINTPGSYSLDQINWQGYSPDGSNAAAIYNNSGGAVTLNLSGGTVPTVRNGAGATTTIPPNIRVLTITGLDSGSIVRVFDAQGGTLIYEQSEAAGQISYSYTYSSQTVYVVYTDLDTKIQSFNKALADQNENLSLFVLTNRQYENP